jgi:hypothetical protein
MSQFRLNHVNNANFDECRNKEDPTVFCYGLYNDSPWLMERTPRGALNLQLVFGYKRIVHGSYCMPPGYSCDQVPHGAELKITGADEASDSIAHNLNVPEGWKEQRFTRPSVYSVLKTLMDLVQTISAGYSLYQARGDQILRYGYAAFGLTVIPYLVMSIFNCLANALTPDYSCCYVIRSPDMEKAEPWSGCYFEGVIGHLIPERPLVPDAPLAHRPNDEACSRIINPIWTHWTVKSGLEPDKWLIEPTSTVRAEGAEHVDSSSASQRATRQYILRAPRELLAVIEPSQKIARTKFMSIPQCSNFKKRFESPSQQTASSIHYENYLLPCFIMTAVGLIIIGSLSKFQAGDSTIAQRGWVLSWIILGPFLGCFMTTLSCIFGESAFEKVIESSKRVLEKFRGMINENGDHDDPSGANSWRRGYTAVCRFLKRITWYLLDAIVTIVSTAVVNIVIPFLLPCVLILEQAWGWIHMIMTLVILALCTVAIGGMVVVGRMMI